MRIAYVCCDPGVPVFGCKGCSVHVQEVLREFLRQGAEVDLFAVRFGGPPPSDLRSVRLHPIDVLRADDSAGRERALLAANTFVKDQLGGSGPYDLVYERYALCSYAAMEYARNRQTPGILEVNSPLIQEQDQYRMLNDHELAEQTTRRAMISAGAIIAVSPPVADYARRHRLSSTSIYVIPNGVDTARFTGDAASPCPRKKGKFTVGFVGTLKPWHGVANLVDAFGLLAEEDAGIRLLIVGDGPERKRLEQRASGLPTSSAGKAHFTGSVPPSKIPALLRSMDVAVAPYLPQEGFYFSPLKIFEYMAAGLPTVASRVGQISDLVQNSETGVLYPPGDIHALAKALLDLSRHPDRCAQLGKLARTTAVRHFTWESIVKRVLEIAGGLGRPHPSLPDSHLTLLRSPRLQRPTY